MRAIMLMFDSLRKDMVFPCGEDMIIPNFKRLQKQSVSFDNFYVGSMPCMPARRELQTGRYNFMHRSWGPMEPWDNSAPEILKKNNIYTHIVTDHKHYWREGGATYHTHYNTYEFIRGQEGDAWKGVVNKEPVICSIGEPYSVSLAKARSREQDLVNRGYMKTEEEHPMVRTVNSGLEFIDRNKEADNWFLQIECFDPHEPFFVPEKYLDMYGVKDEFNGWPPYYYNTLDGKVSDNIRNYYKGLVTMCDAYVGKVLDKMDDLNLWEDTLLIVTTDHGFLLGEHEWWGKNIMPIYNEIANIPFFVYNPKNKTKDRRCTSLAQNIDVPATLLDFFKIEKPKEMLGKSLLTAMDNDMELHDGILFGYHGSNINITDGKYIYMRAPVHKNSQEIYEYTLMPMHMSSMFSVDELKNATLVEAFNFTKETPVLKIPAKGTSSNYNRFGNRLYDIKKDPKQKQPIVDEEIELYLINKIVDIMKKNDAPKELYSFYGLDKEMTLDMLKKEKKNYRFYEESLLEGFEFKDHSIKEGYITAINLCSDLQKKRFKEILKAEGKNIDEVIFNRAITSVFEEKQYNEVMYKVNLSMRLD